MQTIGYNELCWFFLFLMGYVVMILGRKIPIRIRFLFPYLGLIISIFGGFIAAISIINFLGHVSIFQNTTFPLWVTIVFWVIFLIFLPLTVYCKNK